VNIDINIKHKYEKKYHQNTEDIKSMELLLNTSKQFVMWIKIIGMNRNRKQEYFTLKWIYVKKQSSGSLHFIKNDFLHRAKLNGKKGEMKIK
jgi:hypothetical protein